jgi:hypothetical protein
MSLSSIQDLIGSYRDRTSSLRERLDQINSDMSSIERTLASITGDGRARVRRGGRRARAAVASPGRRRGRRGGGRRAAGQDLASSIAKFLASSSKSMGIPEIVSAVKRAGYQSSSPSFPRIVGMRLGDRKRFKRVKRGVYAIAKRG